ncbi:MAG: ATP-grasp domain-containing protein [Nitrospiraceae bacterium]|nr:ATP-grasp domain-containing protein [Nitrospiraceae bacterium]
MKRATGDRTKRAFDVTAAPVLLVLTLTIQLATTIAIRIQLGSPVIFGHVRAGLRSEPFEMIKFRTMLNVGRRRDFVDDAPRMTRWEDRFRLDVHYVDHHTLFADLKIILGTALSVAKPDVYRPTGQPRCRKFFWQRRQKRDPVTAPVELPKIVFLFTSVGRRVELLRHFIGAAEQHKGRVKIIGTEIDPLAPAAQLLGDNVHIVPRDDDPTYAARIGALCRDQQVTAIFPLIDPDVAVLGSLLDDASWGSTLFASVPPEHIATVSDKWCTFRWLVDNGLPTAWSFLPGDTDDAIRFPLYIKPRNGSGAVHTYQVHNHAELAFFSDYVPNAIIQDFLEGPEITVDAIVGRSGDLHALMQRKRLQVRSGEVSRGITVFEPEIDVLARAVVGKLKPRGPITIQMMWDGKRFCVNEINARMGGGLPLSIAAGVPVADILLSSWAGDPVPTVNQCEQGVVMTRFDESFFTREPRHRA